MRKNPTYALVAAGLVLCLPTALAGKPPPTATVLVDCTDPNPTKHDSINEALETPAEELTIEVSGMCEESVFVTRHAVTLQGGDPAVDGIRAVDEGSDDVALTLAGALRVSVENLMLTGGERGLNVHGGFVHIIKCRLEGNSRHGLKLTGANAVVSDTSLDSNGGQGAFLTNASWLSCFTCSVANNEGVGLEVTMGSRAFLDDTHLAGSDYGIGAYTSSTVILRNGSTVEADSEALRAQGNSTVFANSGATFRGSLTSAESSYLSLGESTQLTNPNGNVARNNSILSVGGGATLAGDTLGIGFGKVLLAADSRIDGDLVCLTGGDAYCDDATAQVTGTSNCGQCLKP